MKLCSNSACNLTHYTAVMNKGFRIIVTLSFLAVIGSVNAARIFVNQSATGLNDGTSWENAYVDLQSALIPSMDGDEIWVAAGTYKPDLGDGQTPGDRAATFTLKSGVSVYGGFSSDGDAEELSDRDSQTYSTVLSGDLSGDDSDLFTNNAENSFHIISATDVDETALLDGFTVTRGNATGGVVALFQHVGSAILIIGGKVQFSNCTITSNTSSGGGAINVGTNAAPTFTNCSFTGNQSFANSGAIEVVSSSIFLINCSFLGNLASSQGGALGGWNATIEITNCTFSGNRAGSSGGAFFLFQANTLQVTNSVIWNNATGTATTNTNFSTIHFNGTTSSAATFTNSLVAASGGSESWSTAVGADGGGNIDTDPLFVTPADPLTAANTVGNLRLSEGSPAIDSGDNTADLDGAGAGTETISDLDTDLVGKIRIQSAIVDMGAYESDDKIPPTLALTGDAEMNIPFGIIWVDPGATATDNLEGDFPATITGEMVNTLLDGSYVVNYDASDLQGNAAIQIQRTVTVGSPNAIQVWAVAQGLPAGFVNFDSDFDNDILTNLEENALGLDPFVSNGPLSTDGTDLLSIGRPLLVRNVTGGESIFTLYFNRRADWDTVGLTYTVRIGENLVVWSDSSESSTVVDTNNGIELVSIPLTLAASSIFTQLLVGLE
jgi:hypothetical protein